MSNETQYTPGQWAEVETPDGPRDAVECLNCGWRGLVEVGGDTCPECGHEGLVWSPIKAE